MRLPTPPKRPFARRLLSRWRERRSESGVATILVAIVVPIVGIGCAATAVDVGVWYVEVQRVQKAADAAAMAGVPFLPQDMASAVLRAKDVSARNGFDDAHADVIVAVTEGAKATQLKVTVTSTIHNTFGAAIGVPQTTISRSSVADYLGPSPMGSPCNTFGNEPNAGAGASSADPTGTAQGGSPLPNCSRTPQLWATLEGPETGKVQGDRYQNRTCQAPSGATVDGCAGDTNSEYDEFGYTFVVKVADAAVNSAVELQLYDPMMVATGNTCGNLPSLSSFVNDGASTNPYVINSDARNRYSRDGTSFAAFCTGDGFVSGGSGANPKHGMTTSFVLREQTDSLNPKLAPVQNDTGGSACIKQYGTYNTSNSGISANLFKSASGSYNAEISSQFHNWVSFCTFTPTRAGDYYLQVRSNVSLGGSGGTYIRSGNTAAGAATGNTTSGEGANSFAIRAVTAAGQEQNVAVSGYNHMPIFVNSNQAQPEFNLIRVLPGAAGQKISFSYFDAGDAASGVEGAVQVLTPADATGTIQTTPFPGDCRAIGGSAGPTSITLTNCSAPFLLTSGVSRNNGKTETITIPIPTDYTCNYASFGGCWYKVRVAFGTGQVNDVTTWDATVLGDPVRLIE